MRFFLFALFLGTALGQGDWGACESTASAMTTLSRGTVTFSVEAAGRISSVEGLGRTVMGWRARYGLSEYLGEGVIPFGGVIQVGTGDGDSYSVLFSRVDGLVCLLRERLGGSTDLL